jgi:competence protein ComEC
LLKVGHHGSATSTTPEILQSVKPAYAVISVGFHTSFGLPKPDVLTRLQAAGTHVYRTDLDGAVTFLLDGRSVTPLLPAEILGRAENPGGTAILDRAALSALH